MTFRVLTLPKADADIRRIVHYIEQRSPQGATVWLSALEQALERLAEFADDCPEADENEFFEIEVKQSLFKTRRGRVYRLVFTIFEVEVRILRVRGAGQAPVKLDELY
jgi:plasmid stabilization system protein ParE